MTDPPFVPTPRKSFQPGAKISTIAAYGAFVIPRSYGTSTGLTGGPEAALYVFVVFYVVCCASCWWNYYRRNADYPC